MTATDRFFPAEMLAQLEQYTNMRAIRALCCLNRTMAQIGTNYFANQHTMYGTVLYKHQYELVHRVLDSMKTCDATKVIAPLSFGKTLVILKAAEHIAKTQNCRVLIWIPTTVRSAWQHEIAKFYTLPTRIKDRLIVFEHLCRKKSSVELVEPRIIITSSLYMDMNRQGFLDFPDIKYLFIDEMHMLSFPRWTPTSGVRLILEAGATVAALGATDTAYIKSGVTSFNSFYTENPKKYSTIDNVSISNSRPKIHFEITPYNSVPDLIAEAKKHKYSIICTGNIDDFKTHDTNNEMLYYSNTNNRAYSKYTKTGATLVSNVKSITEGSNLTACDHMYIWIHTRASGIRAERIVQLLGRMSRISSDKQHATIHLCSQHALIYNIICKIQGHDRELSCDIEYNKRIQKSYSLPEFYALEPDVKNILLHISKNIDMSVPAVAANLPKIIYCLTGLNMTGL